MRHSLLCAIISSICVLCSSYDAVARTNGYFQSAQKDSVHSRIILKARIIVRDLADGNKIDSALVTAGVKNEYTNNSGYVEFDSLPAGGMVIARKAGYLVQQKNT